MFNNVCWLRTATRAAPCKTPTAAFGNWKLQWCPLRAADLPEADLPEAPPWKRPYFDTAAGNCLSSILLPSPIGEGYGGEAALERGTGVRLEGARW